MKYSVTYIKTYSSFVLLTLLLLSAFSISAHELTSDVQVVSAKTVNAVEAAKFDPVVKDIEGWKVYIDPKLLKGKHAAGGAKALQMLANHLQRIAILVAGKQLEEMKTVGIWIEHSHPELGNMQYHPGKQWLIDRGYDARLNKKVHIPRAAALLSRDQMLKQPAIILHELAHGYHDQILGFEYQPVLNAYKKAMNAKLYDKVLTHDGHKVRAYAATDYKEYFAEAVEAYFYRNDFYPFVGAELKLHDPAMYAILQKIWGPLK